MFTVPTYTNLTIKTKMEMTYYFSTLFRWYYRTVYITLNTDTSNENCVGNESNNPD